MSNKKNLKRSLGLLDVFAISTGAMISSGFFLLPGIAASKSGPAVIVAYILAAFMILPALLSTVELSTAMPRSGGTYFFISRSLGPMLGTVMGIGDWLALVLKCTFALVGLGVYLAYYVDFDPKLIAMICLLIFTVFNLRGAKESSGLQVGMVVLLVAIMALFIVKGLPEVESFRFTPFAPFGWNAVLPTAGLVFISFIGLNKVASVSEEVKNPSRNLPLGMILSLSVVTVIYGLGVYIVVGVLPKETLYSSLTPISDTATAFMGKFGAGAITLAAILAFATTGNAGIMSASRYLLAMGRDHVIPHAFSRFSKRKTPHYAILFTVGIILAVILLIDIESIAKLASTVQILVFAVINIAVLVMRESGLKSYDPSFKSPFYPYTQIMGIIVAVVLIPEMGLLSTLFTFLLLAIGIIWYNLYVRHRVTGSSAVGQAALRIAERLLDHDAHALGLDAELRQILKEKGLRHDDPFAQIIREADFIETEHNTRIEDLLEKASLLLSQKSGVSSEIILSSLLERSYRGETPADDGVALPHLLLDEVDSFYLVVARSITGIEFPTAHQSIHAAFVLLGSSKNPSQHLRFLAEFASRAESPGFIDDWLKADGREGLIEVLLTDEELDES